jgi:hypothetical protein
MSAENPRERAGKSTINEKMLVEATLRVLHSLHGKTVEWDELDELERAIKSRFKKLGTCEELDVEANWEEPDSIDIRIFCDDKTIYTWAPIEYRLKTRGLNEMDVEVEEAEDIK